MSRSKDKTKPAAYRYETTKQFRRRAAGTPEGGQFDNKYHAEVDLELTLDEAEANAAGSFEARPYPRSGAQVIDFWLNCEIPRDIIDYCIEYNDYELFSEPEVAQQLIRCEMMYRDSLIFTKDEVEHFFTINEFGVPFPGGQRFRIGDALKWFGVKRAVPWKRGEQMPML